MIKDSYQKNIFLTLITILIFIVIPFSLTSIGDDTSAQIINEKSVGFYQSNTCKISLFQVLTKTFQILIRFMSIIIHILGFSVLEK